MVTYEQLVTQIMTFLQQRDELEPSARNDTERKASSRQIIATLFETLHEPNKEMLENASEAFANYEWHGGGETAYVGRMRTAFTTALRASPLAPREE